MSGRSRPPAPPRPPARSSISPSASASRSARWPRRSAGSTRLVFTAGIGENAQGVRARICRGLEFLGITLDPERNAANAPEISVAGAAVKVLVRRTDEEAMIAGHTLRVLAAG